jgi:2-polyprenyl-6-methoxyphenol hydroxylase-like FAD-dependent oxidoreductase
MKIAIIGCGFAGLSSALLLGKRKHDITLIDRITKIKAVGSGILIQPSSMVVLKNLGLFDYLIKHGEKIDILSCINHKKRNVFTTRYSDVDQTSFGIGIHRAFLFDALYEECRMHTNIQFVLGRNITNLKQLKQEYDLVIIANGTHSELRNKLPIKQHYRPYPFGCVWATVEDTTTTNNKLQQYVYYSQQMLGLLPSGTENGQRLLSVFWSLPVAERNHYSAKAMFAGMAYHHPDPVLMKKIEAAEFTFAAYADVWMKKFNHENVVVIGDAAHGMSPQLGQGANMAFLDAHFLDQVLSQAFGRTNDGRSNLQALEAALNKYSALRRKHIDFYTQASKWLTPLFQSNGWAYGLLRDYVISFGQRLQMSRFLSGHILCGKRTSWWHKKELDYEV